MTQNPSNAGVQTLVGALGSDFSDNTGLDIVFNNGMNLAFATSTASLDSIDLTTGSATLIGDIQDSAIPIPLVGFATRA